MVFGILILYSFPFLHYPYDVFYNLIIIDEFYRVLLDTGREGRIWINNSTLGIGNISNIGIILPDSAYLWHYFWATVFVLIDIDSTKILLRAKIIHTVQIYISLIAIYYFSYIIIKNLFLKIDKYIISFLSLWSIAIWISIFATFSVHYQQVWIMWYSVNYQITLPLFWYITALSIILVFQKISLYKSIFLILQIFSISIFILQAHSMEFLYYLMHMTIFGLVFVDKVYLLLKKYFYIIVPAIIAIIFIAKSYQPDQSLIFEYLSLEKLPKLYVKIMQEGAVLLNGYNRASASINELMYVIGLFGILFAVLLIWKKYNFLEVNINIRVLVFITITSFFILIPLYQFSGGLFGVIAKTMVVNRLYYSASLFVVLPIVVYGFLYKTKLSLVYTNVSLLVILMGTYSYSKYNDSLNHNFYKNIVSIQNSFDERKVGFNLNQSQIDSIQHKLDSYEKENFTNKKIRYYARADIAFVIKYLFHKEVYWEGRRANPEYKKIYEKHKDNNDYKNILFTVPKDFPNYDPYT